VTPGHKQLRLFSLFHKWAAPECDAAAGFEQSKSLQHPTQRGMLTARSDYLDSDRCRDSPRVAATRPLPFGWAHLGLRCY
jgi:hypothetical protein